MPGPFINNDGYEPAEWDDPKPAAKEEAVASPKLYYGHKTDAGPIDLQMSSKGCALLISGGTAVKLGEWALAKIYESFDQTRPKTLANQYDAHEQIHDALGSIMAEVHFGNFPVLGASDNRLMQASLEKSKRIRELLEEIEKVAKS